MTQSERVVNVQKGRPVLIKAGRGVVLRIEREQSGAVVLRNEVTGHIVRTWSPKEAKSP